MRHAVIHLQRLRASADIHAEPEPRERLLKDPLAEIAREEQRIVTRGRDRRQQPQLGYPHVLRLIHNDMAERLLVFAA
jgi:hypothetical protein